MARRPSQQAEITMRQPAAFVSLSRHGSFTRAAAAVGSSQPALTAAIQHLEAAAGLTLFDRTTRRVN
jgi:DNA-binding transcriptional LysR family regulator